MALPLRSTPRFHDVAFRTDIGHAHRVNQDAGGVWTWQRAGGSVASLAVVADGVSAGQTSEEASRLAVQMIHDSLAPLLEDGSRAQEDLLGQLIRAAREANHEVARRPHDSPQTADATTLAAAVCVDEDVAGVWCGDSRIYQLGEGIRRLTRDHSWAEGIVQHGLMTEAEAARDPRAHMITRWLGPPDQDDPGIEWFVARARPGESILCCSDGLYGYFSPPHGEENEILRAVQEMPLQAALDHLVTVALRRGGHDNITAAAIQVKERC